MSFLTALWNTIFSRKLNDEIQQELQGHIEMLEDAARAEGKSQPDARVEARRRFGSRAAHFERTRDAHVTGWLDDLGQDIWFAFRQMRRNTGFTTLVVLIMGLGIGTVTIIFSLVHAVLLHSLPYGDPARLVYLWTPNPLLGANVPQQIAPSFPDFYDWQKLSRCFSSLAMVNQRMLNLVNRDSVTRIGGAFVTASFFKTLDVTPEIGRLIDDTDDQPGHAKVIVISYALWRGQFFGDPGAVGKTLQLDREKYTVIGIMPASFGYPFEGDIPYVVPGFRRTDVWAPLALETGRKTDRRNFDNVDAAIARLRPGVSVKRAQDELAAIEKRLDVLNPDGPMRGWKAVVAPFVDTIIGPVSKLLWLMMGAVGVVLLIACGNVANLLLARVTGRLGEIGIRVGLGAGRARLVRQLLTESLVLAALGGAIGVLPSLGAVRVLVHLNPGNIPRFDQASIDVPVLLVTAAISVLSGGLFGLAPVLAIIRPNLSELLKKSGNKGTAGSSNRLRHALVVTEIALSFLLLVFASLLIRSYLKLQARDPGFSSSTVAMNLTLDDRYTKPEQRTAFFLKYLERVRRLPGVIQAGAGSDLPLDRSESLGDVEIKGFGRPKDMVDTRWVTPGYMEALGMHLLAGRFFDEHDMKNVSSAVIVDQAFVDAYMPGRDPLRTQVRSGSNLSGRPWASVVGVVGNIRHSTLEEKPRPEYFQAYRPNFDAWNLRFVVRSRMPTTAAVVPSARKLLHDLDPALALDDISTMKQRIAEASARQRFQMVLMTTFGAVAVFLAMIGVYGVMAYSVRQRAAEIGLRMALGASPQQLLLMMAQQGLTLVTAGLITGMGVALVFTRTIGAWLYGVPPNDPLSFVLVPLLVIAVAGCACLMPALEAARIDPAIAIRNE